MINTTVKLNRKDINKSKVLRRLKSLRNSYTKVGFPNGGSVASGESSSLSEVATRAYFNEKGTNHIPPRPFMKTAYKESLPEVKKMLLDEAIAIQDGESTVKQSLGLIGEYAVSKIREQISNGKFKANAISTQRKKGGKSGVLVNSPLVDHGQMLQTVQHLEVIG